MGIELRPNLLGTVAAEVEVPAESNERDVDSVRLRRWLKSAVVLLIFLALADGAAFLLVKRERVRKRLNARLEAAFGRPVDVDAYSFTMWGGPTLQAEGIRVGEDPRFGSEYFLRADSLAVRLRWLSLLRGRFELESLALSGPTLNVVNNAAGDWNLAEWLGHPGEQSRNFTGPMRLPFVPKFRKIEVRGGRINFKRGYDKLPFAFVDVDGTIDADGPERWRLDLEATPWRAAEILQQAGTIHLAGSVGGTSSALRPASFEMSWSDASLPDFLRLVNGDDSGIRGNFAVAINAQTAANGWAIQGQTQLTQLHRWDLTVRPDTPSPSLNATARMVLDVPNSTLDLVEASVEGPRSNIEGSGRISWADSAAHGTNPSSAGAATRKTNGPAQAKGVTLTAQQASSPVAFDVKSASIDLQDLVAWLRAFRANIPDGIAAAGFAHGQGTVSGWPMRVTSAAISSNGALLSGSDLKATVGVGPLQMAYDGGTLQMMPATITLGEASGADADFFRLEMLPRPKRPSLGITSTGFHLSGGAADAGAVIAVANVFGWDVARGWRLAGPLRCDLHWPEMAWPWKAEPVGSIILGGDGDDGASLHAPFLNLPLSGLDLRMDLKPGARHVTVAAAQAFGANWTGTFDRNTAAPNWQFALSADRLDVADLDRWLNPRWRESFIDRVLPFLSTPSPSNAVPEALRGSGHLSVREFSAAPFLLQDFGGDLRVAGREIILENGQAQVAGGDVSGSFEANLGATPSYRVSAHFSNIDVGALNGGSQHSANFGGEASGHTEFSMQGTSRSDFGGTLACDGATDIQGASWRGIALFDSVQAGHSVAGNSILSDVSGQFACADGEVTLKNMVLSNSRAEIDGAGAVSFAGALNFEFHAAPLGPGAVGSIESAPVAARSAVVITGTLSVPEVRKATPSARVR